MGIYCVLKLYTTVSPGMSGSFQWVLSYCKSIHEQDVASVVTGLHAACQYDNDGALGVEPQD